jgi:integrase/recombinase XerC
MNEINRFLDYLSNEKRYSKHTIISYKNDLNAFCLYVQEQYQLNSVLHLSHTLIRSWIVKLLQEGISARSVNRKISALKSFYNFYKRRGELDKNPMNKIIAPKIGKRLPEFIPEKSLQDLQEHIDFYQDFSGIRDLLVVESLYQTGMRRSELIQLKDSDVNTERLQIKVLGKGNKERFIPLSTSLKDLILKYLHLRNETFPDLDFPRLFVTDKGVGLYPKFVYNLVKRVLTRVSTSEKRSPHVLRHSFATHLANHGAELNAIKELLGHANLSATQIYTHNTIDKLKKVYKKSHPKAT